jgi:hypothetical protein
MFSMMVELFEVRIWSLTRGEVSPQDRFAASGYMAIDARLI